jgi:hypothetical protein
VVRPCVRHRLTLRDAIAVEATASAGIEPSRSTRYDISLVAQRPAHNSQVCLAPLYSRPTSDSISALRQSRHPASGFREPPNFTCERRRQRFSIVVHVLKSIFTRWSSRRSPSSGRVVLASSALGRRELSEVRDSTPHLLSDATGLQCLVRMPLTLRPPDRLAHPHPPSPVAASASSEHASVSARAARYMVGARLVAPVGMLAGCLCAVALHFGAVVSIVSARIRRTPCESPQRAEDSIGVLVEDDREHRRSHWSDLHDILATLPPRSPWFGVR